MEVLGQAGNVSAKRTPAPVVASAVTSAAAPAVAIDTATDDRRCRSCFSNPTTWVERPGKYFDRVRVECRVCGRFVGYRMKG